MPSAHPYHFELSLFILVACISWIGILAALLPALANMEQRGITRLSPLQRLARMGLYGIGALQVAGAAWFAAGAVARLLGS